MKTFLIASPLNHRETVALTEWPDAYLHVRDEQSGDEWVCPIHGNAHLDLETLVKKWVSDEFGGELELDGGFMRGLAGTHYARIMTDNRPPDSIVCWTSGGVFLKQIP